jgi:transcriptional regulator with XRE-family HTH domain
MEAQMNMLQVLLEEEIKKRRISEREVSRQTKLAPTTIGRVLKGEMIDIETILIFSRWLHVNPSELLNSYLPECEALTDKVALIIEKEPRLRAMFCDLINNLQRGEIDTATIDEILAYTFYRLSYTDYRTRCNISE